MTFKSFEEFECWQDARVLDNSIHKLTMKNGFERDFKLRDQILGATGSIMDNVAEGFDRSGNKEFVRFLTYSKGSAAEVKSQLYRALDREYINQKEFDKNYKEADVISKKIGGLIKYLVNSEYKGPRFKTSEPEAIYATKKKTLKSSRVKSGSGKSRNSKLQIKHLESKTRNPKPGTRNPKPGTQN